MDELEPKPIKNKVTNLDSTRLTKFYNLYSQLGRTNANITLFELLSLEPFKTMLIEDLRSTYNYGDL